MSLSAGVDIGVEKIIMSLPDIDLSSVVVSTVQAVCELSFSGYLFGDFDSTGK
jgi:hypothetical protein